MEDFCIRFVFDDQAPPSPEEVADLIHRFDSNYRVVRDAQGALEIYLVDDLLGVAELLALDDPGGNEDIQDLLRELDDVEEADEQADTEPVSARLWNATGLLTLQVLWQDEEPSAALTKLNPLWGLLLGNYSGMVQADHEGYYDATGQLLDMGEG